MAETQSGSVHESPVRQSRTRPYEKQAVRGRIAPQPCSLVITNPSPVLTREQMTGIRIRRIRNYLNADDA